MLLWQVCSIFLQIPAPLQLLLMLMLILSDSISTGQAVLVSKIVFAIYCCFFPCSEIHCRFSPQYLCKMCSNVSVFILMMSQNVYKIHSWTSYTDTQWTNDTDSINRIVAKKLCNWNLSIRITVTLNDMKWWRQKNAWSKDGLVVALNSLEEKA